MEEELRALLEREYDFGSVQELFCLKGGVSNTNYRVTTSTGVYVARVCRYEPENQLNVMVPFLEVATRHGVPTPRLVRTRNGNAHVMLGEAPVIVTSFVDGETGQTDTMGMAQIAHFAVSLAKLHACNWQPSINCLTLHPSYILGVYRQFADTQLTDELGAPASFKQDLAHDYTHFSSDAFLHPFEALPRHVVHGDLIPGNVMFAEDGTVSAFIDLEEIGMSTRLLDIARVMTMWFFRDGAFEIQLLRHFMGAYTEASSLTDGEQVMLEQVTRYVTFRHAVFMLKMVAQRRISSLARNEDIAVYYYVKEHGVPVL